MGRKRIIEKSNVANNELDTSKWLLTNTVPLNEEKDKFTPPLTRPFQRVLFDALKLDVNIAIKFYVPEGYEYAELMDRIYLLVVIDTATRLIMGYHLCLKRKYSSEDVLYCIKNAVVPKEESQCTIPNFRISEKRGFHCTKFPDQCRWAVWDEFLYDNGKVDLSKNVTNILQEVIGCSINACPIKSPSHSPTIERFFGSLEQNRFHKLLNTTGRNPSNTSTDTDKNAIKYAITEKEIEELVESLIADYNGTSHKGIGNLTPLEVLEQMIKSGVQFKKLPEEKRNESIVFSMKVKRKVCGNFNQGIRPYINFEGVRYRNNVLDQMHGIIGETLELIVDINDLRAIRAFLPDGGDLGLIEASGKWLQQKHSLKARQIINKLRINKQLHFTQQQDPIEVSIQYLKEKANANKSARNELAKQQKDVGINRPELKGFEHPINTGRYFLLTNESNKFYETAKLWIESSFPGGIIYGSPRVGKTKAIKSLPTLLGDKLPVFIINCRHFYNPPSKNAFFEELLMDVGHEDPFSGRSLAKSQRLFNFLLSKGQQSEENRIIFIIDNAQELVEEHLCCLMDIRNQLKYVNIDLTLILVGNKALLNKKSVFHMSNFKNIIKKFMLHEHEFHSVETIEDIHACLVGYDEETAFPVGSNCSFTRYFFPKAYDEGFRLSNYTQELYQAFINVRQAANVSGKIEIPMQYLTKTVEHILITYGVEGRDLNYLSQNIFEESIQCSGYIDFIELFCTNVNPH
jgi:hypothetical protein